MSNKNFKKIFIYKKIREFNTKDQQTVKDLETEVNSDIAADTPRLNGCLLVAYDNSTKTLKLVYKISHPINVGYEVGKIWDQPYSLLDGNGHGFQTPYHLFCIFPGQFNYFYDEGDAVDNYKRNNKIFGGSRIKEMTAYEDITGFYVDITFG